MADGGWKVHRIPRGAGKENPQIKRGKGSVKDVLQVYNGRGVRTSPRDAETPDRSRS